MATKRKVNKTLLVTEALAQNPGASPKELAETLTKQGIKMSPGYVSTIKSSLKRKGGAPATAGRRRMESGDSISIATLIEAKDLVNRLGGIEKARTVIETLAQLK